MLRLVITKNMALFSLRMKGPKSQRIMMKEGRVVK